MDNDNLSLDDIFQLEEDEVEETEEAEKTEEAEEEGEKEQETAEPAGEEQSAEVRHANAARRREAERKAMEDKYDAEIAAAGLKNPYRNNEPVKTRADLAKLNADRARKEAERDIRANGLTDETVKQLIDSDAEVQTLRKEAENAKRAAAQAQIEMQFKELQKLDPRIKSLGDIMNSEKGEEFRQNAALTRDLVKAYKLTYMDELMLDAAEKTNAAAGSGKDHLRRSGSRAGAAATVSQETIEWYKTFDPHATIEEIAKYETKYQKSKGR